MKNILFIICFVSIGFSGLAQQVPQYSQYLRNQFMVNPGAAGVYDFTDVTLSGRWQWVGFGDEPRSAYLSFAAPLGKRPKVRYNPGLRISQGPVKNPEIKTGKLKHALGGQVLADQYGAFRKMQAAATYALHLPVSKKFNLSFGARVGLSNHSFLKDIAQVLNTVDPTQGYVDNTYESFVSNQSNKFVLDIGAGFYLYSDKAFFGISADQLSKDFVEFGSGTANFNNQIHFMATAGYKFNLNENLSLTPAILAKMMSPAPLTIEGSLQLEYKEWIWAAVSYRHTDAFIGMVGLNISERFKLGYSYDFSVSRFNQFTSGGHEVILGLMLGR
jgi:type IX secretion system PorP/SprF family membrane protein